MTNERRERYAAAMYYSENPEEGKWEYAETDVQEGYRLHADAAMAVADEELAEQLHRVSDTAAQCAAENARLRAELERVNEAAASEVQWCSNEYEALLSRVRAVLDEENIWLGTNAADLAVKIRAALDDN